MKKAKTSTPPPDTDSEGEADGAVVDQHQGPNVQAPEGLDAKGHELAIVGPDVQTHEGHADAPEAAPARGGEKRREEERR